MSKTTTAKLHGNNKMTVPKWFCDRYPTKNYLIVDKGTKLEITPIIDGEIDSDLLDFYESLRDLAEGRVTEYASPEELIAHLEKQS